MNSSHLRIRKTDKGHFTLVQLAGSRKRVAQKHWCGALEEVIDRLLDAHEKNKSRQGHARDFGPVLEGIQTLSRRYPCLNREDYPANWTDLLELYGCLVRELDRFLVDLDSERKALAGLIFDYGPEWVWKNRLRLVAERVSFLSPQENRDPPSPSVQPRGREDGLAERLSGPLSSVRAPR